jgi:hypothetical protein
MGRPEIFEKSKWDLRSSNPRQCLRSFFPKKTACDCILCSNYIHISHYSIHLAHNPLPGNFNRKDIGLTSILAWLLYIIYSLAWYNKGVWPHSSNHASGLPQQGAGHRHLPYPRVSTETSFVFECFGFRAFSVALSRHRKFEYCRKCFAEGYISAITWKDLFVSTLLVCAHVSLDFRDICALSRACHLYCVFNKREQ